MWALGTCVAIPLYVSQPGVGVSGAISKSFDMTRNNRWVLLGAFLVLLIGAVVLGGCIGLVWGVVKVNLEHGGPVMVGTFSVAAVIGSVGDSLTPIWGKIGLVFTTAIYLTLRESKGKATPEATAAVFE